MTARRSRQEPHRTRRTIAILIVATLSLTSIAIDASNRATRWSLVGVTGSVVVLALHAGLTRRRHERLALQLLLGPVRTTPAASTHVARRATG